MMKSRLINDLALLERIPPTWPYEFREQLLVLLRLIIEEMIEDEAKTKK